MSDPADEPDEGAAPRKRPSFPVMFGPGRRSWAARVLSPLRGLFRAGPASAASAGRGVSGAEREGDASAGPGAIEGDATVAMPEGSQAPAPRPDPASGPLERATIQLLPGRLVPLDPSVVQQEVRFLRSGGRESVVTIGWDVGEPPGHVMLDHPSIQLRHARMRFRDGQWSLENLSERDPAELNGEPLGIGDEPRLLRSGDRIRLGQAVFRFVLT